MRLLSHLPSSILVAALALAACGSGDGDPLGAIDAGSSGDGGCVALAELVCEGNDAYYRDSCGQLGEIAQECTNLRPCNADEGRCCDAARATGPVPGLSAGGSLEWGFASAGDVLEFELQPNSAPQPGPTIQNLAWRFIIAGEALTFGLRTELFDTPNRGAYVALDSTAANPDILRLGIGAQATTVNGTYGAQLDYDWGSAPLTMKLIVQADDFVEAYLVREQVETLVGGLLIPGGQIPTTISFIHLVTEASDYSEVPLVDLGFSAPRLGGTIANAVTLAYQDFVNSDVVYNSVTDVGRWRVGGLTPRCQQAGSLW